MLETRCRVVEFTVKSGNLTTTYAAYTWKEALRLQWRRILFAICVGLGIASLEALAFYGVYKLLTR